MSSRDVPGTDVARVVCERESPWTAAALPQVQTVTDGAARRSIIAEARARLREALAAGPRPAAELRAEAEERGIGYNALTAGRKAEGVTAHKERVARGHWLWTLDDGVEESASPRSPDVQTL